MRGFTLLETLVTVALFGVVMLALASVTIYFYKTNANILEQSGAISSARRGIESAMKDLREATTGEDGSYAIASAGPNAIVFYVDIDEDSAVERVRYDLADTVLSRYTLEPSGDPPQYSGAEAAKIISDNVRNALFDIGVFTYFDREGNQLADNPPPADIAFVTATIVVNVNPTRAPEEFTLTSSATLRNMRAE